MGVVDGTEIAADFTFATWYARWGGSVSIVPHRPISRPILRTLICPLMAPRVIAVLAAAGVFIPLSLSIGSIELGVAVLLLLLLLLGVGWRMGVGVRRGHGVPGWSIECLGCR